MNHIDSSSIFAAFLKENMLRISCLEIKYAYLYLFLCLKILLSAFQNFSVIVILSGL